MAAIEAETMELHPEKRSKSNLAPQQIPHLPPEIITDILSRLPVKSLLQFRSVSKSWRSIISDPKFVKTQLNISSKNDEVAHRRLIFWPGWPGMLSCHLSPLFDGISVDPTMLDYPVEQYFRFYFSIGSINGLICLSMDKHVYFWNPTTRISKKLPHSGIKLGIEYSIVYGFGYDESTDDYKLVEIFSTIDNGYLNTVMVYSLRADCWRRIGSFPSDESLFESGKSGKFVNGAIHWLAHSTQYSGSNLPYSKSIVSLDLAKETYGEVSQPSYAEGEFDLTLDVSRDCLFVLCDYPESHADVWMMKEYGVRESWTKLSRIPNDENDPGGFLWLLHITKNGEILLQMGTRIVLYDPKSNSLRIPDIHNFDACYIYDSNIYIESLVSPLIE